MRWFNRRVSFFSIIAPRSLRKFDFLDLTTSESVHQFEAERDRMPLRYTTDTLFTHVITHEFHHKGQLLTLSRILGYVPPDEDIIHWLTRRPPLITSICEQGSPEWNMSEGLNPQLCPAFGYGIVIVIRSPHWIPYLQKLMLRTTIKSAIRNLHRNASFTLINLTGLALSMSLSLLIILVIKGQYSFDKFHEDSDRIYRINTEAIRASGDREPYASSPLAIAASLDEDYALTDEVIKIDRRLRGNVMVSDKMLPMRGLFVSPNFLSVFNFPLATGNADAALVTPHTIVFTQQAATRLFGDSNNVVGREIEISRYGQFTVTGVLEPLPGPTHFEFEALASLSTVPILENNGTMTAALTDPRNYYSGYTYVVLKDGITQPDLERALTEIAAGTYSGVELETRDKSYRFYTQALSEITPGAVLSNNMGRGMPEMLLIFMGVLAAIIMVMACFNYTQLMIAKALTRAKEVGIRKIVGANRFQVFGQLILEGIVFAFASLAVAYLILQLIKPGFQQLHINMDYNIDLTEDYTVLVLFILFAVVTGTFAGMFPAGYLSAFKPLHIVKSAANPKFYSRITFRKALMTTQFAASFVFIMLVITVYRQVAYMTSADYGIREDGMMNVRLQGNDFEKLSVAMSGVPGVVQVAGVSHSLGTWADGASDYRRSRGEDPFVMRDFSVDENYLRNINVNFVAGENFAHGDRNGIIINEKALSQFGFDDALSAVNQAVILGDSTELLVKGVIKDFHFRPLSYEIGPVAFRYDPENVDMLSVMINGEPKIVASRMEAVWKKIDQRPFSWTMMSDEIDQAYADAGFEDIVSIIGFITVIAVTLSALGMLGMVMYTTEARVKEVGVRKILGAGVRDVLLLLSRSFLIMVGIGVAIGIPLSIYIGNMFLETYAYKVPISTWTIGTGVMAIFVVTGLIIASQTVQAARSNPVNALRHE